MASILVPPGDQPHADTVTHRTIAAVIANPVLILPPRQRGVVIYKSSHISAGSRIVARVHYPVPPLPQAAVNSITITRRTAPRVAPRTNLHNIVTTSFPAPSPVAALPPRRPLSTKWWYSIMPPTPLSNPGATNRQFNLCSRPVTVVYVDIAARAQVGRLPAASPLQRRSEVAG